MKLYVLDLGKIVMMGDNPVTKDGGENPAIPIHAFLIDSPAGHILFDTGCHPQAMEGAWPKELCGNPYIPGEHGSVPEHQANKSRDGEFSVPVFCAQVSSKGSTALGHPPASVFLNTAPFIHAGKRR